MAAKEVMNVYTYLTQARNICRLADQNLLKVITTSVHSPKTSI